MSSFKSCQPDGVYTLVKARFRGPRLPVASLMHPKPSKAVRSDGQERPKGCNPVSPELPVGRGLSQPPTRCAGLSGEAGGEVGDACGEARQSRSWLSDRMLTPEQMARRLGVHRSTITRKILAGEIRAVKVGNRHRVPYSEFHRYREDTLDPPHPMSRRSCSVTGEPAQPVRRSGRSVRAHLP